MKELVIAERRILRKILGPIEAVHQYRKRYTNEVGNHIEKITVTIRKKEELLSTDICNERTVTDSQK